MENYTFSNSILRVKADHEVELLPGFHRIVEKMSDAEIMHSFTLIEKIKEGTVGANFYAWYSIRDYSRTVDAVSVVAEKVRNNEDLSNTAFVILSEQGSVPTEKMYQHEDIFGVWAADVEYKANKIVTDPEYMDGTYLFKCRQGHSAQIYPPHVVPALWERIPKPGEGSHDNPIPYDASVGMTLENGKFYTENDVLYECFRDSGVPVYNTLESLVGLYVQVSNE